MTQLITPPIDNTEKLVEQVLLATVQLNSRIKFLVPAGESRLVIARIRTMMSRRRNKLRQHEKRVKYFRLNSTVHRETHDGQRFDCIVMWREVTKNQEFRQIITEVEANG
jgi:hypothetical protein